MAARRLLAVVRGAGDRSGLVKEFTDSNKAEGEAAYSRNAAAAWGNGFSARELGPALDPRVRFP